MSVHEMLMNQVINATDQGSILDKIKNHDDSNDQKTREGSCQKPVASKQIGIFFRNTKNTNPTGRGKVDTQKDNQRWTEEESCKE
mgnify:CR=1 FL=1